MNGHLHLQFTKVGTGSTGWSFLSLKCDGWKFVEFVTLRASLQGTVDLPPPGDLISSEPHIHCSKKVRKVSADFQTLPLSLPSGGSLVLSHISENHSRIFSGALSFGVCSEVLAYVL